MTQGFGKDSNPTIYQKPFSIPNAEKETFKGKLGGLVDYQNLAQECLTIKVT